MSTNVSPASSTTRPITSPITGPVTTGTAPVEAALHAHVAPFRAWYAGRTPRLSERYAADRWQDVAALVRHAGPLGLTDVCTWTPEIVREVTRSHAGCGRSAAEEVIEALELFLVYLGETGRWTGHDAGLRGCLDALDAVYQELTEDDFWEEQGRLEGIGLWGDDEDDDRDGNDDAQLLAEDLRRQRSPEFQRALLDITLMVASWKERAGRAS